MQSVATRILVERERARMHFRAASYWDIDGLFAAASDTSLPLAATLVAVGDSRVATGRDFDASAVLTGTNVRHLDESAALALVEGLSGAAFTVRSVEERPYRRSPYAPFMTSTLQQEAGRKLRFASQRTMQIAQRLYENGYITYMRTDSTSLSETAVTAARSQARDLYGAEYVPERPRTYTRKVKNAQEAHEAIRPAGDTFRTPGQLSGQLNGDEFRLYELIWQRTVASQMADAVGTSATVRVGAAVASGPDAGSVATFQATGKVITFPGFLRAYVEGSDDPDAELEDRERRLPAVREGDAVTNRSLTPRGHTTSPPARYTEASLVKTMEELGIGRPSTYASILGTIVDRGYAWRKGSALVPTWIAFAVVQLLEENFTRLVDYRFTSSVEDDLDEIAAGNRESTEWLTRFYFGAGGDDSVGHEGGVARSGGLKLLVESRLADIDAREVNSIPIGSTPEGTPIVVRVGRYGPYVSVGEGEDTSRATLPEDLAPDELTAERALELLAQPSGDRELGIDPTTGEPVTLKIGRYGPYVERAPVTEPEPAPAPEPVTVGAGVKPAKKAPAKKAAKSAAPAPARASLFKDMDPETVTLEDVLPLLQLPRTLGVDAASHEPITAQNGRYGPYVKRGTDSRSLQTEPQLLTVTLEEALALLAEPKARGRAAAAPPLRELGDDAVSQKPMVIKEGRFGPYVTDGETNASLRKGDEIAEITAERASELLADRRARGPATKARRAPAKKSAAKKAPAKKPPAAKKTAKKAPKKS